MEQTLYLTSAYLAPVAYYAKMYQYNKVRVERFDHYMKQTYRNRCVIAAADGPLALTIPTEKADDPKCLMRDVRISDHGNWRHIHWNALVAAYRHSPFFEYYADDFRPFYERKIEFLWDFNEQLRQTVCSLLDLHPTVLPTDEYRAQLQPDEADYRELIHPKRPFAELDASYHEAPYYQVFKDKHGFLPGLSIIDLLFNMGPEGLLVLSQSVRASASPTPPGPQSPDGSSICG
jgi:hypothetical protein